MRRFLEASAAAALLILAGAMHPAAGRPIFGPDPVAVPPPPGPDSVRSPATQDLAPQDRVIRPDGRADDEPDRTIVPAELP